ncbi:hypothetical protein [Bounagaea algeriensis]
MADEPGPHAGGPVRAALAAARDVRWRAPELAWAWCARAGAADDGDRGDGDRDDGDWTVRLETETLAAFAANRLGRPVTAAGRAVPVVRELPARHTADPAVDRILGELYVELAWCSGACGAPETARRALRSVLDSEVPAGLRAHALLAAAALPQPPAERVAALDESERLYSALPARAALPALARVAAARAVHRRRSGEFRAAAGAAQAGLARLEELDDPAADSGAAWAWLVLERVQALLELGSREQAETIAAHAVRQPARAASAPHLAWLGLVLATRVQAPRGDFDTAVRVLHDAAALAERHGLDAVGVDVQRALSQLHERTDRPRAALRALRTAYAVERRWRCAVHAVRVRLCTEVPAALPVPRAARAEPRPAGNRSAGTRSAATGPADSTGPVPDVPAPVKSAGPPPGEAEAVPVPRGREGSAAQSGTCENERGGRAGRSRSAHAAEPDAPQESGAAAEPGAEASPRSRRTRTPAAEVLARHLPSGWPAETGTGHRVARSDAARVPSGGRHAGPGVGAARADVRDAAHQGRGGGRPTSESEELAALADQAGVAPPTGREVRSDRPAQESALPVAAPADAGPAESGLVESGLADAGGGSAAAATGAPAAEEVDPSNAGLADLLAGALAAFESTRGGRFDDTDPAGLPAHGAPASISDLRAAENLRRGEKTADPVLDGDAAEGPRRRRRAGG